MNNEKVKDVDAAIRIMSEAYDKESIKSWEGVIQLIITGQEECRISIINKSGNIGIKKTKNKNPDVIIQMEDKDFFSIVNGEKTGTQLFYEKKADVDGNFEILFKFEQAFAHKQ